MRYTFDRCVVDTASREVRLDGTVMELSPKAFELLTLLIDARPRVVTKAEVMQALWPDTFVQEANIPVLVREVRLALGDAEDARVIKTHHRVGYAFAADVHETRVAGGRRPLRHHSFVLALPDHQVVLVEGEYTVGRQADCDVRVNDASVSRVHARIVVSDGEVRLEDLQSKNGTKLHGALLSEPAVLAAGDVVTFGAVEAHFLVEDETDTATGTI
jgi:DNA-binding winged helix-turn-helix (wHTH) protein